MEHINAYLVGGAVRDTLLGLDVKDKDYVVVGSNASELLALGFEQVGMGFPVFLHPWTNEEYALARREKKVGLGYTGFEFETGLDVTLEEDLSRRDILATVTRIIGPIAKPDKIQFVRGLPKTRSGKIMRRILRKIAEGDTSNMGDTTTLLDPTVVEDIKDGAL